jgi:hypothetical protein
LTVLRPPPTGSFGSENPFGIGIDPSLLALSPDDLTQIGRIPAQLDSPAERE